MLDNGTKRKIDNARDILVGKLPDPKSQVEQITIALIYKFMDDMDRQSEEWGGKPTFFTDKYEKYSWSKIFDPKLGGFDRIALYTDAIVQMNQNPNLPQLFRDIFKNAYLPYRDPETLKSFLKEINEFSYDHGEKLGDAFEYLLSIMDSQGEAGQFRTPRHIIDFIVEIVAPKKNETVLDPACGTAGFLISSYKHILTANSKDHPGDKLTPGERKRLLNNFIGYDISPDMVRLSRVNMYLHGFSNPTIVEYDTLTSEERWNDTYDMILANPPFMSPRGGIRPHKRFSIQSKRSEVLFVDYIAEHLNPGGRAGVIVPEGIIFQSQTAYKNLRKMLVEGYLWAVVSLPAGVFNPYSGVKTSILLMDKTLAKKMDKILFVKIDNDGFDLGAQRRPIDKNDLPQAIGLTKHYLKTLPNTIEGTDKSLANVVPKVKIGEGGDWNLSGERYQHIYEIIGSHELHRLDEIFTQIGNGKNIKQMHEKGKYRVTRIETISTGRIDLEKTRWTNDEVNEKDFLQDGDILLSHINSIPHLAKSALFTGEEKVVHGVNLMRFRPNTKKVIPQYAAAVFKSERFIEKARGFAQKAVNQASIKGSDLKSIEIPLPHLDIQKTIVAEIDGYQKIIDGARQVVDNYTLKIKIDPEWDIVELGKIARINSRTADPKTTFGKDEFVYIDISCVGNGTGVVRFDNLVKAIKAPIRARRVVRKGDILLSTVRPNLKAFAYLDEVPSKTIASTGFAILSATDKVIPQFVYHLLFGEYLQEQMVSRMGKGSYPSINQKDVNELRIPLPPLSVQKQIVAQIETEQELVNANKKLTEIFEQKIRDKISEVWGGRGELDVSTE